MPKVILKNNFFDGSKLIVKDPQGFPQWVEDGTPLPSTARICEPRVPDIGLEPGGVTDQPVPGGPPSEPKDLLHIHEIDAARGAADVLDKVNAAADEQDRKNREERDRQEEARKKERERIQAERDARSRPPLSLKK